ncbi:helix-turn-helix domain-containing protein [Streptomyces spiramyceticus]|uniref:helix-turn-helix domain-containing protein n=1 Tax=Streptomyces spiramyceticus TaxID=299717 RepID=UPI00237C17DC|nr:helix-turn-helix transcriptional regulator [Streptomyces spiramyceticus]
MGLEQSSEGAPSPRQQFAEALRSARELHPGSTLSQTDLARKARTSKSTISRVETGTGPIPPELPPLFDQVFATDGLFKRLYEDTVAQSFPELYRRRMALEREAVAVWEWSPTIVPGLLQTGGYARAILRKGDPRASDREISANVGARLARQDVLRGAAPPDVRVVLCESVIRRRVGTHEVMRDQLATLLAHGERATTRIQILPLDAEAHLLIEWPVTFLTGPNHVTMVCVEAYRSAAIIDDQEPVRAAVRAYDGVTSEALSARDSADLIRDQMESL